MRIICQNFLIVFTKTLTIAAYPSLALALDCEKGAAPIEKAICSDPNAQASDRDMETAFKTYRAPLTGDARQSALDDQRAWLSTRNETCTSRKDNCIGQAGTEARCVEDKNRARTRVLLGHPEAGSGLTRSPTPLFVRLTGGRKRFEVEVRVYRFDRPQNPGETSINDQAKLALRDVPEHLDDSIDIDNASYHEIWTISYGSIRLVSFEREYWEYSGGAHGTSWTSGLNINLAEGKLFNITDIFDVAAMNDLYRICFGQLVEKMDMSSEPMKYDDADPEAADLRRKTKGGMAEANAWTFGAQGATVHFGYLNGYAAGPDECVIPFERLDPLAKHPYR